MLRYIYADDLHQYPVLARTMFRDRAHQFHTRLKWQVTVDADGNERDEYDALNPMYVIWEQPDGTHGGSLRFLPTTGPCMVNDHFRDLTDGVRIESPLIWECTRFCLAPKAEARVSAALMLGGMEAGRASFLTHAVGVFDARMVRIYRRLGWGPIILGHKWHGARCDQRRPLVVRGRGHSRKALGSRGRDRQRFPKAGMLPRSMVRGPRYPMWPDRAFVVREDFMDVDVW